jgi:hypothetical protein
LTATRLPAVPRALCSPLTAPRASLPLASQAYGTTPGAFNRLVLHEHLTFVGAHDRHPLSDFSKEGCALQVGAS